jgi:hypothetical protein
MRRTEDIVRGRRIADVAAAKARTRSSTERAPATWIKAVHYDGDGWTETEGTELWISDPGQRDANGERLYTAGGDPWGPTELAGRRGSRDLLRGNAARSVPSGDY